MVAENSNMLLGVGDKPDTIRWILLAIQHVCAMFGATILVPIVVNTTAGADILSIPVALVSSGLGTLIYLICTKIKLLCIVAAPKGIKTIEDDHPDVEIFCAVVDRELNENAYILPGLGDAGDRVYGTK